MSRIVDLPPAFVLGPTDLFLISQSAQSKGIPAQRVSPTWGPTPAEQAAFSTVGVFNPVTCYLENDVRRYGAVGQGEDNTIHITTALAVAAANGRPPCFAGLNLFTQGNHVRDVSLCGVEGDGCLITCTTTNTIWTDFASGTGSANNVEHVRHPMYNVMFRGQFTGTGIGLLIADAGEPAAAFLDYYSVAAEGFQTACQIGNNAYIIKFFGGAFSRSSTGFLLPQALTNAAEQVSFNGTKFTDNSAFGVDNQNGNSDLKLDNCHIDGNNLTYYRGNGGSRTYMNGCHIEILNSGNQSVDPIQVLGTNCYLNMDGGSLIADPINGSLPALSIFNIAANATVRVTGGKLLNNLKNTANNGAGVLARGAGRMIIDPGANTTYQSANLPLIVGVEDNFNLLSDGQFLQATIQDNICITDSNATSRTASPSLTLAIGTNGAQQCLTATKSTGIGTSTGFAVIVPCQPGQRMSTQGQYACSATAANNVFLYSGFGIVVWGANGLPIFVKFALQNGANITNVSPAFTYFNTGGQYVAPNWATHYFLNVNLNGLAASTFYLDNLVMSQM